MIGRKNISIAFYLLIAATRALAAEEPSHTLERIVVTPSRIPASHSRQYRMVSTITGPEIDGSAYTAIQDTIGGLGAIDMRRRGPEGVQADVSIRGATFEESQVLLDGIKINDPQTGHHNMDLTLTRFDLERVDILKGPGSSIYGPNALGGAIHLITKKPDKDKVIVDASGGSYGFFTGGLSLSSLSGPLRNRFSFQEDRSTGYHPETEFNIFTLSEHAYLDTPVGDYDLLFGWSRKDFGADSFYSDMYDKEEEHTDTRFFKIGADLDIDALAVRPKLFLKRHRDKFILDRTRPGWQTNQHTTYNYGGDLGFVLRSDFADVAYGFELSQERIDSTSMGEHRRTKDGIYFEISPHISERLGLNVAFREDRYDTFGWQASPSVGVAYNLCENWRLRSSVGKAFRAPTFTDLYYRDAANTGNPGLKPETAWSYEAGLDFSMKDVSLKTTVFRREARDTIDWTRQAPNQPWQARNTGSIDTNGLEIALEINFKKAALYPLYLKRFSTGYTALDSYFKHDYLSKYVSDYLKHHVIVASDIGLPFGLTSSWVINCKKRKGDSGFIVVDTALSKELSKDEKRRIKIFLDITNLFDVRYSEESNIEMPGIWIKSGARAEF